jgi:transcription antitermination factor NusG
MEKLTDKQDNWYVIYTYPQSERKICNELGKREITAYLPTRKETRIWSDRKKKVEVPVFPNYVFVKVPAKEMWGILKLQGVVRFISFEGAPAIIKESDMDLVKKITTGYNAVCSNDFNVEGDIVRVKQGPLEGLTGKVVRKMGSTRLFVELETVRQAICIEIDAALLSKV